MSVFMDTSAFLAVIDADDQEHARAKPTWEGLLSDEDLIICSSYVLVETLALVQRRLGMEAVRDFHQEIYPILSVV